MPHIWLRKAGQPNAGGCHSAVPGPRRNRAGSHPPPWVPLVLGEGQRSSRPGRAVANMAPTVRADPLQANRVSPGCLVDHRCGYPGAMVGLIVTRLVIWLILAVLGLVVKGRFWLFI